MFKATKLDDVQLNNLKALIAEVKQHEERTVTLLGDALPLALNHVWGNENVTMINDLIGALSPINRKASIVFFDAMQPHEYKASAKDKRVKLYGKRVGKKHTYETKARMEKFFSLDPETGETNPEEGYFGGDYWLWADTNVKVEAKDVNYVAMAIQALNNALDKQGLTKEDIDTQLKDAGFGTSIVTVMEGFKEDTETEQELLVA